MRRLVSRLRMHHAFAIAAVFLLCPVFMIQAAFAQGCPQPKVKTHYSSEIRSTKYTRTESASDLTQWQMGHDFTQNKVLGVGGGSVGTKLTMRYEISPAQQEGTYCVLPVAVLAEFYAAPEIHIASNFARGSCEYSEVLAHEQKHIDVLRKFHREYKSEYRDFLRQTISNLPDTAPVTLEDAEAEKKATTGVIMAQLNAYTKEIMAELSERQQEVDTKDEYARVIAKCDNWEKKLAPKKR